jgi:glycosyltransferase involved in cell wall biosynthesis
MMLGRPVIATRIGFFPEVMVPGGNGIFVDSNTDAQELAEAVKTISLNFSHFSSGAREVFAEHFSVEGNAGRFSSILARAFPGDQRNNDKQ